MTAREANQYDGIAEIEETVNDAVELTMRSPFITPEEMDALARYGSLDHNFGANWRNILTPFLRDGIPSATGSPEERARRRRWEATRLAFQRLMPAEYSAFVRANHNEPTQFLGLRSQLIKRSLRYRRYWMCSPDSFVCRLIEPGQFGVILGPPGSGKSFLAGLLMENLKSLWDDHQLKARGSRLTHLRSSLRKKTFADDSDEDDAPKPLGPGLHSAKDLRFVTNISVGPDHPVSGAVDTFHSVTELLLITSRNENRGCFQVVFFDEYGGNADTGRNTKAKQTLEYLPKVWVRKSGSAMVWMSQRTNDIPDDFRQWASTRFEKISESRPSDTIVYVEGVYRLQKILDFPKTSVPIRTKARSPVIVDVYDDWIREVLAEAEDGAQKLSEEEASRHVNEAIIRACEGVQRRQREASDSVASDPPKPRRTAREQSLEAP